MPEPIIKLKDLEITYNPGKANEYKATQGVSMEIYPGEFVAFFGPSGCGKSTIFYCILGVLPPSAGELYVMGQNPYSFSPEEMVNFQTNTIGIIYQAFFLINSISVIDNVVLPQIFHGVAPGKRRRWAKELLKRFDMEKYGEKFPDNLSGGQSQRVSVSRSMVNNPKILLADEPTGNLDSVSTKQVMESLAEINRVDKKTVIIITHNAAQLSYAHRVFYMKDGLLERIVPNPEKKQIAKVDKQKILVTEMDKLAKIYPYETPTRLKVKSLVNYLTQDIDFDQILRLEDFIELMVERKICKEEFIGLLSKRYHEGGLGLFPADARNMADKVEKVLKQSEDARRFRRRFMNNNFFSREDILVQRLTKFVAEEHGKELDAIQKKRLKELVYKRVAGLVSSNEFENALRLPILEGGVSISRLRARRLTLHFEKILIQGTETKGNEH
ncbi:MAG: ABC transporter ATP-binding protein [Candidatus Falkowbacteria bacterium GW2011_GWC2_38_22]|uniref:ABC transporter ATP-binding protein n=1 Tax=Candidatus Falkowbacteria bacterium GW2011_GWE1_38_31 TaxID=1618638 RepID=A0A0G0MYS3_9BACT|nr:MAG: ABC transporter ATP-binding protein [Candidatus Falkowbacteria bacterium GW2011_GWF2_38_1205]KKQ61163.1 MAG: ABC transporter ATP-binding protein [Candidatus Falkowbacteria bacterium GW2011_GWC2_38_22]KKQ63329.1 MAG: ABC transporter ATP-binding protein [Candidatus Falkowbacteria bacterium GW2011_GWF1_38_22]KKQ65553.1 MAG: ABC transporter ATP-binding protein [Candidatus Falkowbacteria bacterium GW2011_GWE2_38_254]KKQ70061.1 MAG: ABC transporter ATP-binding protein [Candidatus Falkowbacter